MQTEFDLQKYLADAIENIVADSIKATFDSPRETAFLMQFAKAAKKASGTRQALKEGGEKIPPFLMASITRDCNLNCAGCYVHANKSVSCCTAESAEGKAELTEDCCTGSEKRAMNADDWDRVFEEAVQLGISFIFLVGGEPMLHRGIIERAGRHKSILFPVITNGVFMDKEYLKLFDKCRNLLPVISIEGGEEPTDERRGKGIYGIVSKNMQKLKERSIPFGVSITATSENTEEITDRALLRELYESGCKLVLYIDYVATGEEDRHLEADDDGRLRMESELADIRREFDRMLFIAFPGDEKSYGGCLAAGRGFFHISAEGDAEPCPFAPFSDINVRETSIREAINSKLFAVLEGRDMLQEDHSGGCALSGKGRELESLLAAGK